MQENAGLPVSDNPKQFMIEQLVQLKNAKSTKKGYPCLFDDGNVQAMFRLMDPEARGFISAAQFAEGNTRNTDRIVIIITSITRHTYHNCFMHAYRYC